MYCPYYSSLDVRKTKSIVIKIFIDFVLHHLVIIFYNENKIVKVLSKTVERITSLVLSPPSGSLPKLQWYRPLFIVTNHQLWYPVDSPLASIVNECPQSSSSDLHRFRNLSQHAIVAVNSCDVHREVRYSPEMFSLCVFILELANRPSSSFR